MDMLRASLFNSVTRIWKLSFCSFAGGPHQLANPSWRSAIGHLSPGTQSCATAKSGDVKPQYSTAWIQEKYSWDEEILTSLRKKLHDSRTSVPQGERKERQKSYGAPMELWSSGTAFPTPLGSWSSCSTRCSSLIAMQVTPFAAKQTCCCVYLFLLRISSGLPLPTDTDWPLMPLFGFKLTPLLGFRSELSGVCWLAARDSLACQLDKKNWSAQFCHLESIWSIWSVQKKDPTQARRPQRRNGVLVCSGNISMFHVVRSPKWRQVMLDSVVEWSMCCATSWAKISKHDVTRRDMHTMKTRSGLCSNSCGMSDAWFTNK